MISRAEEKNVSKYAVRQQKELKSLRFKYLFYFVFDTLFQYVYVLLQQHLITRARKIWVKNMKKYPEIWQKYAQSIMKYAKLTYFYVTG